MPRIDYNRNAKEATIRSKYERKIKSAVRIGLAGFFLGSLLTIGGGIVSTVETSSDKREFIESAEKLSSAGRYAMYLGIALMSSSVACTYFLRRKYNKKCLEEISFID